MKYTRGQIEKMSLKQLRKITFDDCPAKCCDDEGECEMHELKDCKQHLLKKILIKE